MAGTKCEQINSEGCKLMGEGGAHETDSYPSPWPGATPRVGGAVSHHPRCEVENTRPDDLAGRRERHLTAAEIAEIVRSSSEETVRRWLKRYLAEGVEGLRDVPHPGAPRKVTAECRERLIHAVRRRPRSLGLPFPRWTL